MGATPNPSAVMILRSEPPLPAFCMPFPIPPATSDISLLRLSVLRILTGQKDSAPQLLTHPGDLRGLVRGVTEVARHLGSRPGRLPRRSRQHPDR